MKVAYISNRCSFNSLDVVTKFAGTWVIVVFPKVVTLSSNAPFALFKEKVSNSRKILSKIFHLKFFCV